MESLDANTREELRDSSYDRLVGEHVSNIMKIFLEKKRVITLSQMLHGWIKSTKLRHETKMLGF